MLTLAPGPPFTAITGVRPEAKVDTPLELARRTWRTSEGYPLASHTEGSGKRTHLHTTLNKSRDERTDAATVTTTGPRAPGRAAEEWFGIPVIRTRI